MDSKDKDLEYFRCNIENIDNFELLKLYHYYRMLASSNTELYNKENEEENINIWCLLECEILKRMS